MKRETDRSPGGASPLPSSTADQQGEATPPFDGRNAPDDSWWLRYLSSLPADAVAIIEPVEVAPGHGGRAFEGKWRLRFALRRKPFVDPLMGWTGGDDPLAHLDMRFPSRDAAVQYCERIALRFTIHDPAKRHQAPVNKQHFELEHAKELKGWPDEPNR